MKLLNLWAGLSLASNLVILFIMLNIMLYGKVMFSEGNLYILIFEWFLATFLVGISLYVFYQMVFKRKDVVLK